MFTEYTDKAWMLQSTQYNGKFFLKKKYKKYRK